MGDWGVSPSSAHAYSLLVHFTTLEQERRELAAAGFELLMAFDAEYGSRIDEETDLSDGRYFMPLRERPRT